MNYKLYHFDKSHNCFKVRAVFNYLNVPFTATELSQTQLKSPEWVRHNPHGRLPIVETDNGQWLWESNAIVTYLAEKHGTGNFYPTDTLQRATVNQWLYWEANHFAPSLRTIYFERLLKPAFNMGATDTVVADRAERDIKNELNILNNVLEGNRYVTGSNLTLADVAIATNMVYFKQANLDLVNYPFVQKWYSQLCDQPWFTKTAPKL